MILPSIENFLKILRFYQLNDIKSTKKLSKEKSKFITSEEFYKNLDYSYEQGSEGLIYPEDEDALKLAIGARLDLSKYFNNAGFPGSYAFNTPDGYRTKNFILDWSSTIKTFQDSTDRITNAYRLSDEECDKAIAGFGVDFINSRTLPSLNRRQTFLLNMCDLYKIKGSPQSIVKALNIIGVEDCYIQEAWVYRTRDGLKNIEIKWIPVENGQKFDPEENKYYDDRDDLETEYWSWGYLNDVLSTINECHWFYSKQEIIHLDFDDSETYIHLPSLTPYFNVKIKYKDTTQKSLINNIISDIGSQFGNYLIGIENPKDCDVAGFENKISFLELWCAFLYLNISYSDYLRYSSLRKFLEKFSLNVIDFDTKEYNTENRYFNLIYKIYTYYKSLENSNDIYKFKKIMNLYSQTSVPIGDLSYSQLKYWWLNNPHEPADDENGLTIFKKIIQPSNITYNAKYGNFYANIYWNEDLPYGYYDVELLDNNSVWCTAYSNCKIGSESMQKLIFLNNNNIKFTYDNIEELYNRIRIVHHRTENNIPEIFFDKPFYINSSDRDTSMDMLYGFNMRTVQDSLFNRELFYKLYDEKNSDILNEIQQTDIYQNISDKFRDQKIRNTDTDLGYKTYFNSLFKYPNSILKEDRDTLHRNTFFQYVIEPTNNYINYLQHDGENLNYINYNGRYPLNKKWNWAISYGKDINETYFYVNYESCKWCRFKSFGLRNAENILINTDLYGENDYGIPAYTNIVPKGSTKNNGMIFYKIALQNTNKKSGCYFIMNSNDSLMEDEWNALQYSIKTMDYSENLKEFLDECRIDYSIENGKIKYLVPPSDLYPSTAIKEKTFIFNTTKGEVKFYFCDTLIKPYSKLAKQVVVAQISEIDAKNIYDNVVDCYENDGVDIYAENNILDSNLIKISYNPYFDNCEVKDITYKELLNYLYINGYKLDINGYIYKNFNYYLDENNYLYIKCIDIDVINRVNKDPFNFRWVRVKCSRMWNNNDTKSIYYKLNDNFEYVLDLDGKRIPNLYGISYTPELTFKNVYDSKRYLIDPVILNGKKPSRENVPQDIYNVLSISNGSFKCYAKYDDYKNQSSGTQSYKFVKESDIPKYINSEKVLYNKDSSLLNVVNFGLNQDLVDWMDAQLVKYLDSSAVYEELLIRLSGAIQDYIKVNYGIVGTLDVYNNHIFRSRLITNIINFYKPKRDRMLSLTSSIGVDDYDRVFGDGTNDFEYNKLFLNDTDSKESLPSNNQDNGLHNRAKIKHEINEYIPFDDLIYLDKDRVNVDVYNEREVYEENIIPQIEYFDKLEPFEKNQASFDEKNVYPTFYCSNFDPKYTGYYYKQSDNDYYCNDYVFIKREFFFSSLYDIDGTEFDMPKYISVVCWVIINRLTSNINDITSCLYISEPRTTSIPWLNADGEILKYKKISIPNGIDKDTYIQNNFVKDYFLSDFYNVNIKFQIYTEDNIYAKLNLRDISPVLYFGNFELPEYNGYYYSEITKCGYPAYTNNKGKMICLFDMSMLPDQYLDTYISDYRNNNIKCNRFWIITDYKEIPDFSDAKYFAFEPAYKGKESIFEYDNNILTDKTKTFYKCTDVTKKDYIYVTGVYGWNINILTEHPEYLNPMDRAIHKYRLPESYSNMIGRRVSQNILPEKYVPISAINFYFDYSLSNIIKNGETLCRIMYTNNHNENIILHKRNYTFDEYGKLGALHIEKDQIFTIEDLYESDNKTIVFKARNCGAISKYITENDGMWHTYTIATNKKNPFYTDYKNLYTVLYVDGKPSKIINYNLNIKIVSDDCSISDFAIFNTSLPDWYISIISDFGIFRYRKNVSLDHNIQDNSTYYGRWIFGVPPTTIGDRLHSKYVNYIGEEDFIYPDPKNNLFGTYRWNILSRYYPDCIFEMTTLWESKIENRIYDRELIPHYNKNNEIDRISVGKRIYNRSIIELNGNENFPRTFENKMLIDGVEYSVPNNYICNKGNIPPWYIKDPKEYKTGDIVHNPVHISFVQNIEDPYPIVKHGEKYVSYFDYDHLTDGIECGNNSIYQDQQYDDNTHYVDSLNQFINEEDFYSQYNYDIHDYNNVMLENHNNRHSCFCENIDKIPMFYDPSIIDLTQDMKDNHIYHTIIRLKKNGIIQDNVCGIYNLERNFFKEVYDFDYCYTNIYSENNNYQHFNDVINSENKIWSDTNKDPDNIDIAKRNSIVHVYYDQSGYYSWELRQFSIYLYNPEKIDVNTLDNNELIKNVDSGIYGKFDDVKFRYNIAIFKEKIAFTYIKDNYIIPYQNKDYNFINQFQFDICGQKLCKYIPDLVNQLNTNYLQYIEQEIIHNDGFINYETLKFKQKSKIKQYFDYEIEENEDYDGGRFYLLDNNLYIKMENNWYGPFYVKSRRDLPKQLSDIECLDTVYTKDNFYVKTQKGWVSVHFNTGTISKKTLIKYIKKQLYEKLNFNSYDLTIEGGFSKMCADIAKTLGAIVNINNTKNIRKLKSKNIDEDENIVIDIDVDKQGLLNLIDKRISEYLSTHIYNTYNEIEFKNMCIDFSTLFGIKIKNIDQEEYVYNNTITSAIDEIIHTLLNSNEYDISEENNFVRMCTSVAYMLGATVNGVKMPPIIIDDITEYNGDVINEIFNIEDRFFINMIYTDKELSQWSYYVDTANILQTLRIFKDNNFRIKNKKENDFENGFINKQTVTDYLWIYAYYICIYPVERMCLCEDYDCICTKNPRCKHLPPVINGVKYS